MRRILHGEIALFTNDADDEFADLVQRVLAMQHDDHLANAAADVEGEQPVSDPAPRAAPAASPAPPTFNPAIIDRVTRYEGPLEKAFYRALRELLDLQSRRRARAARRPASAQQGEGAETTK